MSMAAVRNLLMSIIEHVDTIAICNVTGQTVQQPTAAVDIVPYCVKPYVCVCVCVRESVCWCLSKREGGGRKKERERGREGGRERSLMCLCLSERERERERAVWEGEEREGVK